MLEIVARLRTGRISSFASYRGTSMGFIQAVTCVKASGVRSLSMISFP